MAYIIPQELILTENDYSLYLISQASKIYKIC